MGLRFRKSFKVGPVRYTVGKTGVSRSVGVKGYRRTKTASGAVRSTVSLPGTGLSYSAQTGGGGVKKSASKKKSPVKWVILAVVAILGISGLAGGGEDASQPAAAPSATVRPSITVPPVRASKATTLPLEQPEQPEEYGEASTKAMPTPEPTPRQYTYVLNTGTGKFHVPSCSSVKKIKDSNRQEYTGTREDVIAMGYEPCGSCHP